MATKTERQISLIDTNDEYQAFVEKFKPKKTTDDCYTPENVYEAVVSWCVKEYVVNKDNIVRPFWPGGDYERFEYPEHCAVIDNPPFSILSEIVKFYEKHGIKYFLFAPALTLFDVRAQCSVAVGINIVYENGADISTSFVTNMDEPSIRACPELYRAIDAENKKNLRKIKKQVPKYKYPNEVLTAAMLNYMAIHETELIINRDEMTFIRALDSQVAKGKTIFGSGYLLSEKAAAEKAAAEKAAAEKAAAEKAAAEVWELSANEWAVVRSMERK